MMKDKTNIRLKDLFISVSATDIVLMTIGSISSIVMGILQPLLFLMIATIVGDMYPDQSRDDFYETAVDVVVLMIYMGFLFIMSGFFAVFCWIKVGSRQSYSYKAKYLKKLTELDFEWYDSHNPSEITSASISNLIKIEKATGDKIVIIIFTFSMIVTSLLISLISDPKLTLIILPMGPLVIGGLYYTNKGIQETSKVTALAYKEASAVAEEALQEIKTVSSLNAQKKLTMKFAHLLETSKLSMIKNGIKIGGGIGFAVLIIGVLSSVLYIIGAYQLKNDEENWITGDEVDLTDVLVVLSCTIYAYNNVGTLIPSFQAISEGKEAAGKVLEVIQLPVKPKGYSKRPIEGSVVFDDVHFCYPSSNQTNVLQGISFRVDQGDRLGIVGSTGSGKSTIASLLLRFYDSFEGSILIDDIPIGDFDTKYLRKNISYVGQEPLLFNDSIHNNIKFGNLKSQEDEVVRAAKFAEALDFIEELPEKFKTIAGSKGSQLSGGQKQRIAIARAVLRKPKILVLDESTSALDRNTEFYITNNLDKALGDCTRITIAQNLSTIRDSTNIIFIEAGKVIEEGSHDELMAIEGKYYHLVKMQEIQSRNEIQEIDISADVTDDTENNKNLKLKRIKTNYVQEVLKMNHSDKLLVSVGIIGTSMLGIIYPFIAMIMGFQVNNLATKQGDELIDDTVRDSLYLLLLSFLLFLAEVGQFSSLPKASANITTRMRESSFKAMLSFDTSFFDNPKRNPAVLSSRLSKDCEDINAIGETMIGMIAGNIILILVSFAIATVFSWKVALVSFSLLPIIFFFMLSVYVAQMKGIISFSYQECGGLLSDFVLNYKSVKAFNLEKHINAQFEEIIKKDYEGTSSKGKVAALTYGAGFGIFFFIDGLIYWYAASLFKDEEISFKELIVSVYIILVGVNGFVLTGVHSGDIGGGFRAAKKIFKILKFQPTIDIKDKTGFCNGIEGGIEFRNVSFSYPYRDIMVLKNISFEVPPASKCAIIGRTGSGKSTILQLLIRLYDPSHGSIHIDSVDIKQFNLKFLRKRIGVVSQEPVLFSGTIAENVSLGMKTERDEIEKALQVSEAMEFIENHNKKADREVGFKGGKLSGGQKQRLALARCLIRRPQIVVLDEATSALDSQTESIVLDNIYEELNESTWIMIAHRLKTIEKADKIVVLESGRILEEGSQERLLEEEGYFYNLISNL